MLTAQGQLLAYAYVPAGLSALPGFSLSVPADPNPPAGLAPGWAADSVGVLYPSGWAYEDLGTGNTLAQDAVRSLTGQTWAVYQGNAVLQSVVLPVGHAVDDVRVEDANCAAGKVPPNCTGRATLPHRHLGRLPGEHRWLPHLDGCAGLHQRLRPAGTSLCCRLARATTDPTVTPVVDVTNLYEIAERTTVESPGGPAVLCLGSGCQIRTEPCGHSHNKEDCDVPINARPVSPLFEGSQWEWEAVGDGEVLAHGTVAAPDEAAAQKAAMAAATWGGARNGPSWAPFCVPRS